MYNRSSACSFYACSLITAGNPHANRNLCGWVRTVMYILSRRYIWTSSTARGFILGHDEHSGRNGVTDASPGQGICWHHFETCQGTTPVYMTA